MKLVIEISEHNKRVIDDYVEGSGYSYKQLTRTSIIESLAQAVHKGTIFQREQRPHGKWIEVTTPELTTPETTYKAYMCSSCRTRAFINPYVYAFFVLGAVQICVKRENIKVVQCQILNH